MKNLLPQYKAKITASVDARKYTVLSLSADNSNVYAQVQSHNVNPIGTYIVSTPILDGDVDSAVYIVLYLATGAEYKR
jgi:proline dehydrogenase